MSWFHTGFGKNRQGIGVTFHQASQREVLGRPSREGVKAGPGVASPG